MVNLKDAIIRAANIADEMLRAGANGQRSQHEKGDRDFALTLDLNIEKAVKKHLAMTAIPVLGEELAWQGDKLQNRFWVIDPIDGTLNYARNLPLCGVCIALVENGHPVLACISLPLLDERYVAEQGNGVTLNDTPIKIANTHQLNEAMVALGDFAVGENSIEKNRMRLAVVDTLIPRVLRIRMLGSAAVQLAWLAAGRLDVSLILSNNPWDVQAGVLIAREAGAVVFDEDGSEHTTESRYTLATTPALKEQILESITTAKQQTKV